MACKFVEILSIRWICVGIDIDHVKCKGCCRDGARSDEWIWECCVGCDDISQPDHFCGDREFEHNAFSTIQQRSKNDRIVKQGIILIFKNKD